MKRGKSGSPGADFRDAYLAEFAIEDDPARLKTLDAACRTLDEIDLLQAQLDQDGPLSTGGTGQPVAHPALAALRAHRKTFEDLARRLEPTGKVETASELARRAGRARWGKT